MNTNTKVTLITPDEYLLLAKRNGVSRNQAIKKTGLSPRSWAYWCYEGRYKPRMKSLLRLLEVAQKEKWI